MKSFSRYMTCLTLGLSVANPFCLIAVAIWATLAVLTTIEARPITE